ncbi:hypothetical protein BGZ99_001349, partial [Dissophora globulifera]
HLMSEVQQLQDNKQRRSNKIRNSTAYHDHTRQLVILYVKALVDYKHQNDLRTFDPIQVREPDVFTFTIPSAGDAITLWGPAYADIMSYIENKKRKEEENQKSQADQAARTMEGLEPRQESEIEQRQKLDNLGAEELSNMETVYLQQIVDNMEAWNSSAPLPNRAVLIQRLKEAEMTS